MADGPQIPEDTVSQENTTSAPDNKAIANPYKTFPLRFNIGSPQGREFISKLRASFGKASGQTQQAPDLTEAERTDMKQSLTDQGVIPPTEVPQPTRSQTGPTRGK